MDAANHPESRSTVIWLWAAVVGIGMKYVGSTLLTPLYPIYQHSFHFSELIVTAIYAVYVIGNLGVLFFFGRLSDQIGRRPVTLAAYGIVIVSQLVYLLAQSTIWLFPARILNGFGAGLGAAALTAWIVELEPHGNRARAATLATAGNLGGLAFGALLAGVLAQVAPWPLRLSFGAFILLLLAIGATMSMAPETVQHRVTGIRKVSLRPRIGVPRPIRLGFVTPAAIAFAAFALCGFYAALTPAILSNSLHIHAPLMSGGIVALFFAAGAASAVASRNLEGRRTILLALALLWSGLGLLMLAEAEHSMPLLVIATLACGSSMASGFRGSLQLVNEIAPEAQRAEVVSSYLLVCYCSNALPVIGVGLLALIVSAPTAHRIFAIVLVMLASTACAIGLRYTNSERAAE